MAAKPYPKLLTQQQFKAKHPNGNYGAYLRSYKKNNAAYTKKVKAQGTVKKKKQYNWLAPQSPDQLEQYASTQIHDVFDPQMQAIKDSFASQLAAGVAGIGGATNSAVQAYSALAPQVAGWYQQVQNNQRTEDTALYHDLMNSAGSVGGNIAQQLAQAGLDPNVGVGVGEMGGNAAATSEAVGSAALSQLLSQGSAAQSYYGSLPALARQQGAADTSMFQSQVGRAQADALGQVGAQIPAAISDMVQALRQSEIDKAVTNKTLNIGVKKAKLSASTQKQLAQMQASQREADRRLREWQTRYSQQQQNRRNADDNATSRANTQDRINAKGGKGPNSAKARNKRQKATMKMATRLAKTAYKHPDQYGDPARTPRYKAWKDIYAFLRKKLPGATDAQIRELATNALINAGYNVQPGWVPAAHTSLH